MACRIRLRLSMLNKDIYRHIWVQQYHTASELLMQLFNPSKYRFSRV